MPDSQFSTDGQLPSEKPALPRAKSSNKIFIVVFSKFGDNFVINWNIFVAYIPTNFYGFDISLLCKRIRRARSLNKRHFQGRASVKIRIGAKINCMLYKARSRSYMSSKITN